MIDTASGEAAVPDDPAELTRHIERRYHARHREQLPELAAMAARVEALHAGAPQVPAGLSQLLRRLIGELEVHMKKEELLLFPAMRGQAADRLATPIGEMRHDHDDHGAFLDEVAQLTNDHTLPEGACRSWQALYAGTAQLRADLMEHIHLENNVLFPRFEQGA